MQFSWTDVIERTPDMLFYYVEYSKAVSPIDRCSTYDVIDLHSTLDDQLGITGYPWYVVDDFGNLVDVDGWHYGFELEPLWGTGTGHACDPQDPYCHL